MVLHMGEVVLRFGESLRCCEAVQSARLRIVRWAALAIVVHPGEIVLRIGVSVRCCEAVQSAGRASARSGGPPSPLKCMKDGKGPIFGSNFGIPGAEAVRKCKM